MCYFITGTYSGPVTLDEINAAARKYDMEFRLHDAPFVQKQLKDGEIYILKEPDAHCDCGTLLGGKRRMLGDEDDSASRQQQFIRKLRKKGWSEAKIRRSLENSVRTLQQSDCNAGGWVEFLTDLFTATAIRTFGLLLHFYSGGEDEDCFDLHGRRTVPLPDLSEDTLLMMDDDILYVFTRR